MNTDIILAFLILIFSLALLIKSSDYFTAAAEKIGVMCGISPFTVGLTIVSIGTSLPELISSLFAVSEGASEIVAGNVIGSNIANIFLVMAIGAIMSRVLVIRRNLLPVDLPMLIGSAFFMALATLDGTFSRGEALLFILCMVLFMLYMLRDGRSKPQAIINVESQEWDWKPFAIVLVSGTCIYFGAKYTVDSVINISNILDLGKEVVAVSVVALGTSLPELAVTISAVRSNNPAIIVGNVLGSNIFNTFAVMGIPGVIHELHVPESMVTLGIPAMLVATIMFLVVTVDKKVAEWEGWMFLIFYCFFIGKIFNLL